MLRLDGTYAAPFGERLAEHWRRELLQALEADGFPLDRLRSWTRWPRRARREEPW